MCCCFVDVFCCCVGLCYRVVVLLACFFFHVRCLLFACVAELMLCWLAVVMRLCFSVCVFVCVCLFVNVLMVLLVSVRCVCSIG